MYGIEQQKSFPRKVPYEMDCVADEMDFVAHGMHFVPYQMDFVLRKRFRGPQKGFRVRNGILSVPAE